MKNQRTLLGALLFSSSFLIFFFFLMFSWQVESSFISLVSVMALDSMQGQKMYHIKNIKGFFPHRQ